MLDIEKLSKLAEEWYKTVPEDMKNKVIVSNFSIKPMSFTPEQIMGKTKSAARKSKTREEFLKESGLCAEFLETLEKMHIRRTNMKKKEGRKS